MKIACKIFDHEEILDTIRETSMTLTSHRILYDTGSSVNGVFVTMNLENIGCIVLKNSSKLNYGIISILFLFGALFFYLEQYIDYAKYSVILAVFFALFYLISRKKVLIIYSNTHAIPIPVNHLNDYTITTIIDQISEARDNRINDLYKNKQFHV